MENPEKPFWIKPPYLILFDLLRLHRVKPWDVNVAHLLNSFLAEMKRRGHVDFSASGTALLSSAIIHRAKSELVLKMEDPPRSPQPRPDEDIPPPLPMPVRFGHASVSIEELLQALEEVLRSEDLLQERVRQVVQSPQLVKEIDDFLANIEDNIKEFYASLSKLALAEQFLSFRTLVKDLSLIQIVRTFLMILFLANQGRIRLIQDRSEDLLIQLSEA